MSDCCGEPGCRRIQPIRLYRADFGGQVFAVLRSRLVRDRGEGRATLRAIERHDVTAAAEQLIRDNPEWARKLLEGEKSCS